MANCVLEIGQEREKCLLSPSENLRMWLMSYDNDKGKLFGFEGWKEFHERRNYAKLLKFIFEGKYFLFQSPFLTRSSEFLSKFPQFHPTFSEYLHQKSHHNQLPDWVYQNNQEFRSSLECFEKFPPDK